MTNCKCGCECHKVEKKSLAEKFAYISQDGELKWSQVYEEQAKAAVEHFCEIVDYCDGFFTSRDCLERLKKKFREES